MRHEIYIRVCAAVNSLAKNSLPLILSNIGGSISFWLASKFYEDFSPHQFIDLGGAPAGMSSAYTNTNWAKAYRNPTFKIFNQIGGKASPIATQLKRHPDCRNDEIVNICAEAGVERPKHENEDNAPLVLNESGLSFIENKIYNFDRIKQISVLSTQANQHANFGPVVKLLEKIVHRALGLSEERVVVATNSGTSALHACVGYAGLLEQNPSLRWVTSAFGFYSAGIGPLADVSIIDCDERGRLQISDLTKIPDSYDGVIFTNIFSQNSNWSEIRSYCHNRGKYFVVDNATGLFDRPFDSNKHCDFEIISCHHTKPWGVGEGGLIICDKASEAAFRNIINFGLNMLPQSRHYSGNFKLSDLSAAAIIDRLETMEYWSYFYERQQRRLISLVSNSDLPISNLVGETEPQTPRTYTPFVSNIPFEKMPNGVATLKNITHLYRSF